MRRFVIAAVLAALLGCAGGAERGPGAVALVRAESAQGAALTARNVLTLRQSAGRFEWRKNATVRSIGTAWCFWRGDADGSRMSIWATCRHVAERDENFKDFDAVMVFQGEDGLRTESPVLGLRLDEKADLAFFVAMGAPAASLEVMSEREQVNLRPGAMVASCGHFGFAFPAVVTVGWYVGEGERGVLQTAGSWYGVSGSALVDVETMKVIGVRYRFASVEPEPYTDNCLAVPASEIRRAMAEYRATSKG